MHFLLTIFLVTSAFAGFDCSIFLNNKAKPWNQTIDFERTEEVLQNDTIVSIRPLGEAQMDLGISAAGSHAAFMITYSDGTRAVWKPYSAIKDQAEVDAYKASRMLGSNLVPPTVTRKIDGREGSAQFYVKTSIDLISDDALGKEILKLAPAKELSDRKVFYYVFGQWDGTIDNVLVDDSLSLALIDNGAIADLSKIQYGGLPFRKAMKMIPDESLVTKEIDEFPFSNAIVLENPTKEQLTDILKQKVEASEIERYWTKIEKREDKTLALNFWKGNVWVQGIGFQNRGPMMTQDYYKSTLEAYSKLTFESLRKEFSAAMTDEHIQEILFRRDQFLEAAKGAVVNP